MCLLDSFAFVSIIFRDTLNVMIFPDFFVS